MEFKKDDRVKNPAGQEWGLGKVLEDSANGKARVFFKATGEKTISLNHIALTLVTGEEAKTSIRDNSERTAQKRRREYKSVEQLKEKFLSEFPGGFSGKKFIEMERDHKVAACELMNELLSARSFEQLLAAGDYS